MSFSVHLNGIQFLSSKEAARVSGYSSDYVSRLARQGKIIATRIGTQWFVDPNSLDKFLIDSAQAEEERLKQLSELRKIERVEFASINTPIDTNTASQSHRQKPHFAHAHFISSAVVCAGFFLALLPYIFSGQSQNSITAFLSDSLYASRQTAYGLYHALAEVETSTTAQSQLGVAVGSGVGTQTNTETFPPETIPGVVVVLESASSSPSDIADSFSDAVIVTPSHDTQNTGTIVPIFRDGVGESYRYVLVPVDSAVP